ncbi:hypothetical protein E0Z10_g3967 [Xylaria hypoxylon]|uniref:PNPLA domain-containing protein n=1 Tax=Xylaria hypoxylon TaxID=37992 RepID=A0A4Z0YM70_9PEZI|nr:hypothetical protein E0Z10_g3967 [Xylaria hypoxylon]
MVDFQSFDIAVTAINVCGMTSAQACHMCGATEKTFAVVGRSGNPHEKVDPVLLQRLRQVLEPIRTEAEHVVELDQDRESTWFGFDRDSSGHPTFVDHGRFTAIMTESLAGNAAERYPQLVSFIGETVIVLNATEKLDDAEWEIEKATERLMTAIEGAIFREPGLQEHVQAWNNYGKKITSTKQLLKCYYGSITVIRMPSHGSYVLMDRQAERLINLIKTRCTESHITKRRARLLANAERMQVYLQSAFDQFTRDLDLPFDFVKESLRQKPVPLTFEGNILRLAICIKDNSTCESLRNDARRVFLRLAPMVASCIMFDAARQNLMGAAPQLLKDAYSELCTAALRSFTNDHWPCTFENRSDGKTNGRCSNLKYSHTKGHQNSRGKLIGNGPYQANFELDTLTSSWIEAISDQLALFQNAASREAAGSVIAVHYIHPITTSIELTRCPLHVREPLKAQQHTFSLKPSRAGVRILSLDGGGVGAIVELLILRAIQKLLGPKLPIHMFFDLMVGTSAGGLVALGLGARGWSVDEAISKFKTISKEVFRPRDLNRVPFLGDFTNVFYGSLHKTQTLESVLQREFSDELLFGSTSSFQHMPKVAVTSSSIFGKQAAILANYNRPQDANKSLGYHFSRSDTASKEMKIWEAATATFALPRYFKSFHKVETHKSYIGGTADFACPAWVAHREAQLIWDDIAIEPDIFLSIGTGRNVRESTSQQDFRPPQRVESIDNPSRTPPMSLLLLPIISKTQPVQLASGKDPERMWDDFIAGYLAHNDRRSTGDTHRHIRINPKLNMDTPKFDDVNQIERLEREAEEVIYQDFPRIKEITHRLLATSFFFEKNINSVRQVKDGYTCSGSICCRFQQASGEIEGLGHALHTCLKGSFKPYFLIEEQDYPSSPALGLILTESVIRNMRRGYFDLDIIELELSKEHSSINISLCLQTIAYASGATTLPISGFPRQLVSEDSIRVASNTHSALLNEKDPGNDDKPNKSRGNGLVLLSKVPKESISIAELPETAAPIPELQGETKHRSLRLFELAS